jgi:hypothetical protein
MEFTVNYQPFLDPIFTVSGIESSIEGAGAPALSKPASWVTIISVREEAL